MTRRHFDTIIFDLDGTLVDSAPDLHKSLNYSLAYFDLDQISLEKARERIGHGIKSLISSTLDIIDVKKTAPLIEDMFEVFVEHYRHHCTESTVLYEGVSQLLRELNHCGIKLAVCTNKLEEMTLKILHNFEIQDHFMSIVGQDTTPYTKPDPRLISHILTTLGAQSDTAAFIGDSATDLELAMNASIDYYISTFGYFNGDISKVPTERTFNNYDDLSKALLHDHIISRH